MRRTTLRVKGVAALASAMAVGVVGVGSLPVAQAATNPAMLQTGAYFNDPRATGNESNVVRNLVIHHFDHAPQGAWARVAVWNLTDEAIADAMVRAHRRGVHVRVIMAKTNCHEPLRAALASGSGSRLTCVVHSSRSAGGTMHQKSYNFSAVGSARNVTIVGSANATDEAFADQWVDMFQFVNRADIYDAYLKVFALQQDGTSLPSPYRSYFFNGGQGRAQFYPVDDETPTAADDPAHERLTTIPKGPNTIIRVATYAMHGDRGTWLANDLLAHKRAGSRVTVATGPGVKDSIEERFRDAGIPVTRAFDRSCPAGDHVDSSCNYIHLKLMTATYLRNSERQYRVWTGSDNWTNESLDNDEVVHKIAGVGPYRDYVRYLDRIDEAY